MSIWRAIGRESGVGGFGGWFGARVPHIHLGFTSNKIEGILQLVHGKADQPSAEACTARQKPSQGNRIVHMQAALASHAPNAAAIQLGIMGRATSNCAALAMPAPYSWQIHHFQVPVLLPGSLDQLTAHAGRTSGSNLARGWKERHLSVSAELCSVSRRFGIFGPLIQHGQPRLSINPGPPKSFLAGKRLLHNPLTASLS